MTGGYVSMNKEELLEILKDYKEKALERKKNYDLAPRPLTEEETEAVVKGLALEGLDEEEFEFFEKERLDQLLLRLISEEVRRGTFPSSYAKAEGLGEIARGEVDSDYLSAEEALDLLAAMKGGAAIALFELGQQHFGRVQPGMDHRGQRGETVGHVVGARDEQAAKHAVAVYKDAD
ncbi:MAG: hypothetical protein R6V17_03245, partial [Halanaerobacter sp.]